MAIKLFPTDKNELIKHLEGVLKSIPLQNEGMRHECKQLIQQLKEETPHFPDNKKIAQKESRDFLVGTDTNIGVHERFDVKPDLKPAKDTKKRSR